MWSLWGDITEFDGGTGQSHENLKLTGLRVDIRPRKHPNMRQECYPHEAVDVIMIDIASSLISYLKKLSN